jgi:hypothetical protein
MAPFSRQWDSAERHVFPLAQGAIFGWENVGRCRTSLLATSESMGFHSSGLRML